ncbi:hypothetical protein [uncultured Sulfitobacter sp.]|uniref:hypothetical protein n=1 Tax=uncultured Sulfitobacter sp. TaxID=191468 RepID=UPI002624F155|nr:hypothetical protein [uncultured Sulfitobacter sp.]
MDQPKMQQRHLIHIPKPKRVASARFRQRRRFRITLAAVGAVLTANALMRG